MSDSSISIQSARQGLANSSVNLFKPSNSSGQGAEKTLNFQTELESDKIDLSAKAILMARQLQNEKNNVSRASQAAARLAELRDKISNAARTSENAYWVNEDIRVVPTFQGYTLGQMLTSPDSGNFMVEMYWDGSQSKNISDTPADLGAVHPTQSERDEYFGILHQLYNEILEERGLKPTDDNRLFMTYNEAADIRDNLAEKLSKNPRALELSHKLTGTYCMGLGLMPSARAGEENPENYFANETNPYVAAKYNPSEGAEIAADRFDAKTGPSSRNNNVIGSGLSSIEIKTENYIVGLQYKAYSSSAELELDKNDWLWGLGIKKSSV